MQYNDTTNKQGLVQDTYFLLTNVTSTDYPANDIKRNINKAYRVAVDIALKSQDQWLFQDTVATANIVGGQGEYTFKTSGDFNISDVIKIDRVEVSYDGTNWVRAVNINRNDYLNALNSATATVNNDFSVTTPVYSLQKESLSLFPIPASNVANGLKLYYTQDVTDLSSDTDVPVIAPQFHTYLSVSAAYDYAVTRGLSQASALRQEMELMKRDMAKFYSTRADDGMIHMGGMVKNYN